MSKTAQEHPSSSEEDLQSPSDTCVCPTGRVERFLQACVLLFLAEEPSHGYDLFQDLAAFGLGDDLPDTTTLYKNLRRMEVRGLVTSQWQPGEAGPGRRSYQLTPKGWHYLDGWAEALTQGRALIDRFLEERRRMVTRPETQRGLDASTEADEKKRGDL